jgi:hypothetical protein
VDVIRSILIALMLAVTALITLGLVAGHQEQSRWIRARATS